MGRVGWIREDKQAFSDHISVSMHGARVRQGGWGGVVQGGVWVGWVRQGGWGEAG